MLRATRGIAALLGPALVLITLPSCDAARTAAPGSAVAALILHVAAVPANVRTIQLAVSGPGITDSIVFGFVPTSGTISDTISVPAGAGRHLSANAFDSVGVNTYRGDTTLSLIPGTNVPLRLVMRALDANLPIEITFGDSSTAWSDGFEEYTAGTWPSAWIPDGNGSDVAHNYVDASVRFSGNNSMRLYGLVGGCWASIAYRTLDVSPPFEVDVAIRNGDESLSGCNPYHAEVHLRQGTSWTNPARSLVSFDGSAIRGGWAQSDSIASFVPLKWYALRIRYERSSPTVVTLSYWIDGTFLGSKNFDTMTAEDSLDHLELTAIEGSVWFDDIAVIKL